MNKLIIPIIVILVLAAGIVGYFIFQKPAFPEWQRETSNNEQLTVDVDASEGVRLLNNITKGIGLTRSKQAFQKFIEEIGPGFFRVKWMIFKAKNQDYLLCLSMQSIHREIMVYGKTLYRS